MNQKAFELFEQSNIIPYRTLPVNLKKPYFNLGPVNMYKTFKYKQVKLETPSNLYCYDWINFAESEILITRGEVEEDKLNSHSDLLKLIEQNKKISSEINKIYALDITDKEKQERTKELNTFDFQSNKIVFNKTFDSSIDLFKIPFYSWGTYISDRFKALLLNNKISDVKFASSNSELNELWKPHYPIIEFE
jgi:hypothetical protein